MVEKQSSVYSYRQQSQLADFNNNPSQSYIQQNEFKIVVLGTGAVGKSSITIRYVNGMFPKEYNPTLQDIFRKNFLLDNVAGSLEIMDTAGTQEYDVMQDHWIKEGQGFVIVFSVDQKDSLNEAAKLVKRIERIWGTKSMPMVLVANKSDLTSQKVIEKEQGQQLANDIGCPYFETSAKTGHNCELVFMELVKLLRKKQAPQPEVKRKKNKFKDFREWFEKHCNLI